MIAGETQHRGPMWSSPWIWHSARRTNSSMSWCCSRVTLISCRHWREPTRSVSPVKSRREGVDVGANRGSGQGRCNSAASSARGGVGATRDPPILDARSLFRAWRGGGSAPTAEEVYRLGASPPSNGFRFGPRPLGLPAIVAVPVQFVVYTQALLPAVHYRLRKCTGGALFLHHHRARAGRSKTPGRRIRRRWSPAVR